jgi:hypothetical protein
MSTAALPFSLSSIEKKYIKGVALPSNPVMADAVIRRP